MTKDELRQKASWIEGGVYGATFSHGETDLPEQAVVDRETESLSAFLCDQLVRTFLVLLRYNSGKWKVIKVER